MIRLCRFTTFFLPIVLLVTGCTSPITISLVSDVEQIPNPRFVLLDKGAEGMKPSYSHVRLYELSDSCVIPACPLLWDVEVSDKISPRKIRYGTNLGFGTITLTAPEDLKAGMNYRIVTTSKQYTFDKIVGSFDFEVDKHGVVRPVE